MSLPTDLSLAFGVPESALLLSVLLLALIVLAVALYRAFGLVLVLVASIAAPITYFLVGIGVPGCPRFHSMPFGGCSYSDAVVAENLAFWVVFFFAILCVVSRKRFRSV